MSALPPKADIVERDLTALCQKRTLAASRPPPKSNDLDAGRAAWVLQKKRQRNRSQRHSRNDHHRAGDADEVAKKPRDRWRNCGRADRYRVEHAEQMRAPIRCSIVRHRTVDHGGDAIEYNTNKGKYY